MYRYFFLLLFRLMGGWVGQQQSEHCSDLENGTEKWTLPKVEFGAKIKQRLFFALWGSFSTKQHKNRFCLFFISTRDWVYIKINCGKSLAVNKELYNNYTTIIYNNYMIALSQTNNHLQKCNSHICVLNSPTFYILRMNFRGRFFFWSLPSPKIYWL